MPQSPQSHPQHRSPGGWSFLLPEDIPEIESEPEGEGFAFPKDGLGFIQLEES